MSLKNLHIILPIIRFPFSVNKLVKRIAFLVGQSFKDIICLGNVYVYMKTNLHIQWKWIVLFIYSINYLHGYYINSNSIYVAIIVMNRYHYMKFISESIFWIKHKYGWTLKTTLVQMWWLWALRPDFFLFCDAVIKDKLIQFYYTSMQCKEMYVKYLCIHVEQLNRVERISFCLYKHGFGLEKRVDT